MSAPVIPAPPIAAAPPADPQIKDRRHRGFWAAAERTGNTVFLFFLNPLLDPDNNRVSGTKLMAWIVVWANTFDIIHNHSLQELKITKVIDAVDNHNVMLYALAFGIWFGKAGMAWAVDLIKAWKGRESAS